MNIFKLHCSAQFCVSLAYALLVPNVFGINKTCLLHCFYLIKIFLMAFQIIALLYRMLKKEELIDTHFCSPTEEALRNFRSAIHVCNI